MFNVLEEILEKKIPGLEVLKPLTSYKLLVGLPEDTFFNADKIKKEVELSFLEKDNELNDIFVQTIAFKFNDEIAKSAQDILHSLYESQDYWILYVYPNGQFEIVTDIDKTEYFIDMLNTINNMNNMIGGVFISSLSYDNEE